MIAENLSTSVVQELSTLVKQLKDDRRKVMYYNNPLDNMIFQSVIFHNMIFWLDPKISIVWFYHISQGNELGTFFDKFLV